MATEPSRQPLPFEPRNQRSKKTPKTKPKPAPSQTAAQKEASKDQPTPSSNKTAAKKNQSTAKSQQSSSIPEQVSKRMIRRMALLCGIPTALGISSFFISYFLVSQMEIKLPNVAVLMVSMGFWGLGVLGLSYGVLSASWDEDSPGTILGWQEFTTNLGRLTAAWREAKQKD